MKLKYQILLALLLLGGWSNNNESRNNFHITQSKENLIPRRKILPLTVYQPQSPLQLELARLYSPPEGGSAKVVVRFRNISTKAIKAYRVAWLFPQGTGGEWSQKDANILPSQLLPINTMPMGDATASSKEASKHTSADKMEGTCTFLVVRVEFTDGSIYEDEEIYRLFKSYLEQ